MGLRTVVSIQETELQECRPCFSLVPQCSSQGGVAKATRQLHISEDVFSGYNHTVRIMPPPLVPPPWPVYRITTR